MAQPVWITTAGSLGVVEEGKFFQLPLSAQDPDSGEVYYSLLAGELPPGIQVTPSGLLLGIPEAYARVKGVPAEVGENVTSRFSIRAYTVTPQGRVDRINDRTFEITITGQDIPEFVTPPGRLGFWKDGNRFDYQIEIDDDDPNDVVTVTLVSGELPSGLSIDENGLISGWLDSITLVDDAAIGFDRYVEETDTYSRWDEYPWDFGSATISKDYQFTLKVSDGKNYNLRTFSIFVLNTDSMTADLEDLTIDNTYITADSIAQRSPYIKNQLTNLPDYRHDNFYAYQFEGFDPDLDEFNIVKSAGEFPPGLELDPATGFLVGYIPNIGSQSIEYEFTLRVFKLYQPEIYKEYSYSINIFGDIDTRVTWHSPTDLGTIENGQVSVFEVSATHNEGHALLYRLKSGSANRLPRGLKLLESGLIAGRCSYQTFALDGGSTTFDASIRTRLDIDETTFDRSYSFTVEAYNVTGAVNVERTFTITVERKYNKPCQCVRFEAFSEFSDRDLVASLVYNRDIFKPEWIYRPDDPWHGIHTKVWYEHAYGLEPKTFTNYLDSVVKNHYRKKITLGEIKTAQALGSDGKILYEVVYATVVDTATNNDDESAALEQKLKYPAKLNDGTVVDTVYPNSIANMRTRLITEIGQVAPILPRWMLSKQADDTVLGFTKAWVICYAKPGRAKQIKYNIEEKFGTQLNKIDFDVDRYVLGWYAANHWNSEINAWNQSLATTFDRTANHPYSTPDTETLYDAGGTRFISNVDKYEYTDTYDKYVLFPQQRIIDNDK